MTNGNPTIYYPLGLIICISAIKDVAEDLKRHRSDDDENNRSTLIAQNGKFVPKKWREIRVGDVCKMKQDEYFPADMIILNTSDPKGLINCL